MRRKRRIMSGLLALCIALSVLPLSACTAPKLTLDPEELYALPELPERYTALNKQLSAIQESGAEYAAPVSGSNIQPVQMVDLDGDGREEALAFFRQSDGEKPLKIYVFSDNGDSYAQTAVIEGNLFGKSIPAPWCDTEICVKGDYFARHFGKEVTLCIDEYQAAAVDAHIDTLLIEQEAPNMNTTKSGYCAPATVQFSAIANTPTAALFNWKIYRQGEEDNPVVRFTGEEVDYTFNQSGTFIIKLEVSDQSTTCSTEDEVQIDISESYLMIPNAFSPGTTPGINDEFRVAYKSLVKFKAWIFNRWGLQMYYWTDPAQGWDGKKGGKYVQPGVYFYVIEAEGSDGIKYKEKGDINILRPKTIQDENENIQE